MSDQKSIIIKPEIHKKMKMFCAEYGLTIREFIESAILLRMEKIDELSENLRTDNRKSERSI